MAGVLHPIICCFSKVGFSASTKTVVFILLAGFAGFVTPSTELLMLSLPYSSVSFIYTYALSVTAGGMVAYVVCSLAP